MLNFSRCDRTDLKKTKNPAFQRETQGIKINQNYICDRTRIRT